MSQGLLVGLPHLTVFSDTVIESILQDATFTMAELGDVSRSLVAWS